MTRLSWRTQINEITDMAYIRQSRLSGHQSKPITLKWNKKCILIQSDLNWIRSSVGCQLTWPAKSPQQAGTANTLNTAEPTTVPTPMSLFVMNVPTEFMNNSGLDVAAAMNVAPTSKFQEKNKRRCWYNSRDPKPFTDIENNQICDSPTSSFMLNAKNDE